jgi:3-hydroxy-9,10-secoandrosta-1,3,5(10)-triene-9,17-dione monooxygenase reductase component
MTIATDPAYFRRILGHYPTGVCVVTAMEPAGTPVGMVVGSFTSVSLDPPLVAFLPTRTSTSWPRIQAIGRFCVNVLAAHQEDVCRILSRRDPGKFAAIPFHLSGLGSPVLDDVVAWIDCELHAVHEAGDHYIVLGRVATLGVERPHSPLLFFKGSYGQFSAFSPTLPEG